MRSTGLEEVNGRKLDRGHWRNTWWPQITWHVSLDGAAELSWLVSVRSGLHFSPSTVSQDGGKLEDDSMAKEWLSAPKSTPLWSRAELHTGSMAGGSEKLVAHGKEVPWDPKQREMETTQRSWIESTMEGGDDFWAASSWNFNKAYLR